LIGRQPPASVASFVTHQTPTLVPGRSCGCWCEISSTIDSTLVLAKLFRAAPGFQPDRSAAVPFFTAALTIPRSDKSM
jgi:hypothetical protein